jgi:AcrR family transcriptional regulator
MPRTHPSVEPGTARQRTGRRSGETGTRTAILDAARGRFARHGYDGATIRAIALDAGVDPALVHHFFGTKEKLFVEAMRFPMVPSEVLPGIFAGDGDKVGEEVVRLFLTMLEDPRVREPALGLVRSAVTHDKAARMLREFITSAILGVIVGRSAAPDAPLRASLVASQVVGLAFTRYIVKLEPIASANVGDLVAAIGPTIQRYIDGEVRSRSRSRTTGRQQSTTP